MSSHGNKSLLPVKIPYRFLFPLLLSGLVITSSFAQFSPGDLSKSHQHLEGSENCTNCHEVGQEISGVKCLACHREIQLLRKEKHGYHGITATGPCVECHKEHLGRESKTVIFEEKKFIHSNTGFTLSGKHSSVECEKCHSSAFRKDTAIVKILENSTHKTYLGLTQTCISCHADPHKDRMGKECTSCHIPEGWKIVSRFDHARTKFPLIGKHRQVKCDQCHPSVKDKNNDGTMSLIKNDFRDCTPCHSSPHNQSLNKNKCSQCHSPDGWEGAFNKLFSHDITRYKLTGRHKEIECEKCHPVAAQKDFKLRFQRKYNNCTDCHSDKHEGIFLQLYKNDCSACHSTNGYRPSKYSLENHAATSFPLNGAHAAVPCTDCHRRAGSDSTVFRFTNLKCESCHKDVHAGAFASMMKDKSCGTCHSPSGWKDASFDHSATVFPLVGRHKNIGCAKCHKETDNTTRNVLFKKISSNCESCHSDPHFGQFSVAGKTACAGCHSPESWKSLIFNHETQSSFKLTGKHKNVPCSSCHAVEKAPDMQFIRFKPMEISCESCHQKGTTK